MVLKLKPFGFKLKPFGFKRKGQKVDGKNLKHDIKVELKFTLTLIVIIDVDNTLSHHSSS